MTKPKIQWHEWPVTPADGGDLGHGVHFHDTHLPKGKDLVAFIDGFEWQHGNPAVVKGYHIKPNKVTSTRVLAAMKRRIEIMLNNREAMAEMISRRISACANA